MRAVCFLMMSVRRGYFVGRDVAGGSISSIPDGYRQSPTDIVNPRRISSIPDGYRQSPTDIVNPPFRRYDPRGDSSMNQGNALDVDENG
ncbi:MAG: hypothetical protein QM784_13870 [Polyangiaceae bacterium]